MESLSRLERPRIAVPRRRLWVGTSGLSLMPSPARDINFANVAAITESPANKIASITDPGSIGVALAQATDAAKPGTGVHTAPSGVPVATFDGGDHIKELTSPLRADPFTLYLVIAVDNLTAIMAGIVGDGNDWLLYTGGVASNHWTQYPSTVIAAENVDTSWHVLTVRNNGASSDVRRDGVQILTYNGTSHQFYKLALGAWPDGGPTFFLTGKIGRFLQYNAAHTVGEAAGNEAYLRAQFGF